MERWRPQSDHCLTGINDGVAADDQLQSLCVARDDGSCCNGKQIDGHYYNGRDDDKDDHNYYHGSGQCYTSYNDSDRHGEGRISGISPAGNVAQQHYDGS